MNRILLFFVSILLMLSIVAYPQEPDRTKNLTSPVQYGWTQILHTDGDMQTVTTTATSDAVEIWRLAGGTTLWIDTDTTVAGQQPDSCMTVQMQLYNPKTGEWGVYYTTNGSKLDTIPRSLVNVGAGGLDVYMNLAAFDQWQWAQKAKFIFTIGKNDVMKMQAWIGGQ